VGAKDRFYNVYVAKEKLVRFLMTLLFNSVD